MTNIKVVLDTNVILSSFSPSPHSPSKEILKRWRNEEFTVQFSEDILEEYIEKLLEFSISEEKITHLLAALFMLGEPVFIQMYHLEKYPEDPDDIAFLLCALNGKATHLLTYDKHLLTLQGIYDLDICEPVVFLKNLREGNREEME